MSKVPLVIGLGLLALAVYGGVLSLKSAGVIVGSTLVILAAPIILVLCLIIALISVFFCFIKPLVKLIRDLSQSTNNNPSKQTQNSQNSDFFSNNRSASTKTGNSGQETCEQHLTKGEKNVVKKDGSHLSSTGNPFSSNYVVPFAVLSSYLPAQSEFSSSNVVSYQEVTNTQSSNVSNKRVENGEPCSNSDTSNYLPAQSKTKELARQDDKKQTDTLTPNLYFKKIMEMCATQFRVRNQNNTENNPQSTENLSLSSHRSFYTVETLSYGL